MNYFGTPYQTSVIEGAVSFPSVLSANKNGIICSVPFSSISETGTSAYFNTITGSILYVPSSLIIPTSTGTNTAGSIYCSPVDGKIHLYTGTGYISIQLS